MSKKERPVQHGMAIKRSTGDRIFDVINTVVLIALCFVTLYPMWYVLCASFAKLRPRPQSNGTYITWSVMQPASCRFSPGRKLVQAMTKQPERD